jgi:hypothetical protein
MKFPYKRPTDEQNKDPFSELSERLTGLEERVATMSSDSKSRQNLILEQLGRITTESKPKEEPPQDEPVSKPDSGTGDQPDRGGANDESGEVQPDNGGTEVNT